MSDCPARLYPFRPASPFTAVKLLDEEGRRLQRSRLKWRLQPVALYAGLPATHQLAVFEPAPRGVRKVRTVLRLVLGRAACIMGCCCKPPHAVARPVVLWPCLQVITATNIAETSVMLGAAYPIEHGLIALIIWPCFSRSLPPPTLPKPRSP